MKGDVGIVLAILIALVVAAGFIPRPGYAAEPTDYAQRQSNKVIIVGPHGSTSTVYTSGGGVQVVNQSQPKSSSRRK